MTLHKTHIFDKDLELKDAGAVTADGAGTVAAVAKIVDLGLAFVEGDMVLIFNSIDFTTGDEAYDIILQLSNSATFASVIVNKVKLQKGDARAGSDVDQNDLGREIVPFNNFHGDTLYRFARVFHDVGGTTPIINYEAFLTKMG